MEFALRKETVHRARPNAQCCLICRYAGPAFEPQGVVSSDIATVAMPQSAGVRRESILFLSCRSCSMTVWDTAQGGGPVGVFSHSDRALARAGTET